MPVKRSGVRVQVIPGNAVIWTWPGTTPWLRHELRMELAAVENRSGQRLASAGDLFYTIWAGSDPSQSGLVLTASGEGQALRWIAQMRRRQADRMAANRWLAALGADRTEHAARREDCNCGDCQPRLNAAPSRLLRRAG